MTALFLTFWAGLSLLWTPFLAQAGQRFAQIVGTTFLVALVAAYLPTRTKAFDLYLLPAGAALSAIAMLALAWRGPDWFVGAPEFDDSLFQRSMITLIVLVWPALGALALRGALDSRRGPRRARRRRGARRLCADRPRGDGRRRLRLRSRHAAGRPAGAPAGAFFRGAGSARAGPAADLWRDLEPDAHRAGAGVAVDADLARPRHCGMAAPHHRAWFRHRRSGR